MAASLCARVWEVCVREYTLKSEAIQGLMDIDDILPIPPVSILISSHPSQIHGEGKVNEGKVPRENHLALRISTLPWKVGKRAA